jgi:menaquinol-cytochrome c reductase iron-sulfur subunit
MKKTDDDAPDVPADPRLLARRQMLGRVCVGLGVASGVVLGAPMVGFVLGPLVRKPPTDESQWKVLEQEFYWCEPKEAIGSNDFQWRIAPDAPMPRTIGPRSLAIGETVPVKFADASVLAWAGVTGLTAAWLRRVGEREFIAFSVNCAHLGCPVQWRPPAQLFLCPCHGGVYYSDGAVAAGPPPHPLTRYPVRINQDLVEIAAQPLPIG